MNKRQRVKNYKKSCGWSPDGAYPGWALKQLQSWHRWGCSHHLCGACKYLERTFIFHPWNTNCLAKQDPRKETCPFFRSKYSKKK